MPTPPVIALNMLPLAAPTLPLDSPIDVDIEVRRPRPPPTVPVIVFMMTGRENPSSACTDRLPARRALHVRPNCRLSAAAPVSVTATPWRSGITADPELKLNVVRRENESARL